MNPTGLHVSSMVKKKTVQSSLCKIMVTIIKQKEREEDKQKLKYHLQRQR